jgi:tetratricopeptide (TPR) repeat protein
LVLVALATAGVILALPQGRAWYHYRAAGTALMQYHNPLAIRHLQACLKIWPEDADVFLLAARAARRARYYGDAEQCLEQYQRIRGLDEASSFEQLLLSAERDVDQVADVCRRHVEADHPQAALILEALTRGYLRQYRLRQARFCLDRWLKNQPDCPQALCLEGELRLDYQHSLALALKSYRRAVRLDSDHEEARLGLALALLEAKQFKEATQHLEYLRQNQPDNLGVRVGLAECRYALGQKDKAVRLLDVVLAEAPHCASALAGRGRIALESQHDAAAESWLRQAVEADPSNQKARYNLSLALERNGKHQEARQQQKRLEQMHEDLQRFHQIVTHDLVSHPHDPALHHTLGELLLRSGHRAEGVRWLESAARQNYRPAREALARHFKEAKAQAAP